MKIRWMCNSIDSLFAFCKHISNRSLFSCDFVEFISAGSFTNLNRVLFGRWWEELIFTRMKIFHCSSIVGGGLFQSSLTCYRHLPFKPIFDYIQFWRIIE
jgi:hypothetical protein